MNNNRSGTSQLSMSVPKFRAELHKAYIAGQAAPLADEAKRREFVKQAVIDLNWR
jgi:hypothetical protein